MKEENTSKILKELKKSIEVKDLLLLFSIPVILSLIFFSPQSFQESMVLNLQNPNIYKFFTTVFVHSNFEHFFNNLLLYVITIIPLYLMCALSGYKKQFRYMFLIFVFLFPFLLSGMNINLIEAKTSRGFSGINAAFLGYLGVAIFQYSKKSLGIRTKKTGNKILKTFKNVRWKPLILFLYGSGIVAFLYAGILSKESILILFLIAVFLAMSTYFTDGQSLKEASRKKGYFELFLFSILLFLMAVSLLFPKQIKGTNILSHYAGLALGFFSTYLSLSS